MVIKQILLYASLICLSTNAKALQIGIAMEKDYFTADEDPTVYLLYTNDDTKHSIKISKRFAPAGEFWNDIFTLQSNEGKANYIGRLYAYAPDEEPRELRPGESIGYIINLSRLYDLRKGGAYTVQACISTKKDRYKSNILGVFIEGRDNVNIGDKKPLNTTIETVKIQMDDGTVSTKAIRTYDCSKTEIVKIKLAFSKAVKLAARSYAKIKKLKPDKAAKDKLYKTWFCKDKKKEKLFYDVRENWRVIDKAIDTKLIKFYCGCTSAIAFVFPHKAYSIYVCEDFFDLPVFSKLSRASVIVHEMSHFYATASTNDYAYGEKRCKDLVKKRPEMAIRNADNYMYFSSGAK